MVATYPGTVRPWSTKIDLVMDIMAAHVNDLQDELSAIQTFLGVNPHFDTGLFTAGVVQNEGTVSNRISLAEAGKNQPFISLVYVGGTNGWSYPNPSVIPWTAKVADTNSTWTSGANLTAARTGYYSVAAYASMATAASVPVGSHAYVFRLWSGAGSVLAGATATQPGGANYTVELSVAWQGLLTKGDTYHMEFTNASGQNRTLNAAIQSTFLRGQ